MCHFNVLMPNSHMHKHTHGYMNFTHIMYIFRTDEMKEMNPYIGEQISVCQLLYRMHKSGKFYSQFVIGYSHNVRSLYSLFRR